MWLGGSGGDGGSCAVPTEPHTLTAAILTAP